MGKPPAFQFYANDWLSSRHIAVMTPAQEGAYIRLLCYCWSSGDCSIPDDEQELLALSRLNSIDDLRVVEKCFKQHPTKTGYLTNERLFLEVQKQQVWRDKSSKGGKQAAENKKSLKGGARVVQPKAKPSSSFSSSSSSSSLVEAKASTPPTPRKVSLEELSVDHIADWLMAKRVSGKYLMHDEHFILEYFKNYCQSKGKRYADYISALRNAFEWSACQPQSKQSGTKADRAKAAVMRAAYAGGFAPEA